LFLTWSPEPKRTSSSLSNWRNMTCVINLCLEGQHLLECDMLSGRSWRMFQKNVLPSSGSISKPSIKHLWLLNSSILKMDTVHSSEIWAIFYYQTTRHHISEDSTPRTHHHGNLKSCMKTTVSWDKTLCSLVDR
jgi:hypothetical protein